jgi:valyl-tRNA synthetase
VLCDNYLEIIKDRIYNPDKYDKDARISAQYALYNSLLSVLKLMAPIMPHITEAVYQMYFAQKEKMKSIHISTWPDCNEKLIREEDELSGDLLVDVLSIVRRFKSENGISLKEPLKKVVVKCDNNYKSALSKVIEDLKSVSRAEIIEFGDDVSFKCDNFAVEVGITR